MKTSQTMEERFEKAYGSFQLCEPICKKDHDRLLSFIRQELKKQREEIRELIAKDRVMFLKNNIIEMMQLDEVKKVRKQLRKEILVDLDALSQEKEGGV